MSGGAPDAALVRSAQGGSDAAFGILVNRHQQALRGFLRRVCRNWAMADDIAQDVFIAAWSKLDQLEDPDAFRSWITGMAWRRAAEIGRSAGRRRAREASWVEAQDNGAPDGISAEDNMALSDAMAELTPDQRACVALCLAGSWSHGEAAKTLGIPVGTVKSHIARGRARLLEALGGDNDA